MFNNELNACQTCWKSFYTQTGQPGYRTGIIQEFPLTSTRCKEWPQEWLLIRLVKTSVYICSTKHLVLDKKITNFLII